jgi:lactoylglutathione lyase
MRAPLTAPRWSHVALPSSNIDKAVDFYTSYTPLAVLSTHEDEAGRNVWLASRHQGDCPFVLVLVMFYRDQGRPQPTLAPFAHIGIEVPARADVDHTAERARAEGCLVWEPQEMPPPVGYVCALADPDGNIVEISYGQGVFEAVEARWNSN